MVNDIESGSSFMLHVFIDSIDNNDRDMNFGIVSGLSLVIGVSEIGSHSSGV